MSADRRRILLLLQWGAGLAALAWALAGVDPGILLRDLRSFGAGGMLAVLAAAAASYVGMGFRLSALAPGEPPFPTAFRAVLLCVGMNCILPAKAGDALKVLHLAESTGRSRVEVASAVVWERACDVAVLASLMLLSWTRAGGDRMDPAPLLAAAACGAALFLLMRARSASFRALYGRIPNARVSETLVRLHGCLVDGVALAWVARGLLWSLAAWIFYFLSMAATLRLLGGLALSWPDMLVVFTAATVGKALPSLPGGIGLVEGAVVASLSWYGVGADQALGLAIFYHAVHFLPPAAAAVAVNGRARYWRSSEGTRS